MVLWSSGDSIVGSIGKMNENECLQSAVCIILLFAFTGSDFKIEIHNL